jgi:hypothetical protein
MKVERDMICDGLLADFRTGQAFGYISPAALHRDSNNISSKAAVRQLRCYTRAVSAKLKEAAHLNVVYTASKERWS